MFELHANECIKPLFIFHMAFQCQTIITQMKVKTGEHNSVPVDLTLNMVKFTGKQKHKVSRQIYMHEFG